MSHLRIKTVYSRLRLRVDNSARSPSRACEGQVNATGASCYYAVSRTSWVSCNHHMPSEGHARLNSPCSSAHGSGPASRGARSRSGPWRSSTPIDLITWKNVAPPTSPAPQPLLRPPPTLAVPPHSLLADILRSLSHSCQDERDFPCNCCDSSASRVRPFAHRSLNQ